MTPLVIFVTLLFLFSLVSRRLERTVITAPIVFTIAGMLMFPFLTPGQTSQISATIFLNLAEIGLVLLLFTDASRTDLGVLRAVRNLPSRLLSVGMLLTIALGMVAARLVLPGLSWSEAGILSAILAPTDAGLGQVIVNSTHVPKRVRQALNIEAGLNDGLSVPFLLFFMAAAAARIVGGHGALIHFVVEQLGGGVVVGLLIGAGGGWLVNLARRREWISESFQQIGIATLPLLCLLISDMIGASMFIAAFVAGLSVQLTFKEAGGPGADFAEEWGQLFNLSVFFLFGVLVMRYAPQFRLSFWVYALLSLTIVRMLPVAIALVGTRLSVPSVLFMGWFGPRGLASIVLGIVYVEEDIHLPGDPIIRLAVIVTVLLSIFAHGFSATPGIRLYEKKIAELGADTLERRELTPQ
jgi:sodium/hydrogen antiporter